MTPAERKASLAEALRASAEKAARQNAHLDALRRAKKLDQERWQSFLEDPTARQAFEAKYFLPVPAPSSHGVITVTRGGKFWDTWTSYIVTEGERELTLVHRDDGGYLDVAFNSPEGNFRSPVGTPSGNLVFGTWDGPPNRMHRQIAAMLRQLQDAGHYAGRDLVLARTDRRAIERRHFATFAASRGWPTDPGAEEERVTREHYRASA